jgi:hypothetical protein
MKFSLSILTALFCASAIPVHGQEAADTDLQSSQSRQTPQPSVTPAPSIPELPQIDEVFKQTSLGREADEQRMHVEWRQLANRVANDPDLVAAKRAAEHAHTDLEKRQRLRDYYEIYYGRMRALASSAEMKTALDQQKAAHLSQINQPRVRPETDAGLPTPTPARKQHRSGHAWQKDHSE